MLKIKLPLLGKALTKNYLLRFRHIHLAIGGGKYSKILEGCT